MAMVVGSDVYMVAFWQLVHVDVISKLFFCRFWVALRFQQLLFIRKFARAASFEELLVNPRVFVWAYHSDCLDNLFGSVIPSEPSWQEMRTLGMGFWYANIPQLRARVILSPFLCSILLHAL